MRVVVADTGPLQYLLLIGQIVLLPQLYGEVTVPTDVHDELLHPGAPPLVREWATLPPPWLKIMPALASEDSRVAGLDAGEAAAISLALTLPADLVLMDERAGVATARAKALNVIGTIGVLDQAASAGLIDVAEAVGRLKATNFRYRRELLDGLLAAHGRNSGG